MTILNDIERNELAEHEATIERGLQAFLDVSMALIAVKEKGLYRGYTHDDGKPYTWEEYLRIRWDIGTARARQLMNSAEVVKNLSEDNETSTMVGVLPTSERHIRPLTHLDPDQQREAWQRAVETAPEGKITAGHVQRVVDEMAEPEDEELAAVSWSPPAPETSDNNRHAVHFSSATPEHYTPSEIIQATLDCLGSIELDPCSNSHDQPNVPAAAHFTIHDDGLAQQWSGRVYMNPPYGREIGAWVDKLCEEHKAGRTIEAIALVPARTDTQWWQRLRNYPVCFVVGRLKFGELDESAPFPSAVFYLGNHIDHFFYAFEGLGDIWQRVEPGLFGED